MAATREAKRPHAQSTAGRARARRRKPANGHLTHVRKNGMAAVHAIGGKLAEMRDDAYGAMERTEAGVHDVERTLRNYIRQRPMKTLVIGASVLALAGLGVVLGVRALRVR